MIKKNKLARLPEELIIKADGGIEHCRRDVTRIITAGMKMGIAGAAECQITPALHIVIDWAPIEGLGVHAGVPGIDGIGVAIRQFSNTLILGFDRRYSVGISIEANDSTLLNMCCYRLFQL